MRVDPELKKDLKTYLRKKLSDTHRVVTVISTYPLSKTELSALKISVPKLKDSVIKNEVDKEILGGLIIRYGSKMIDISLRRELQNLKKVVYERT